MTETPTTFVVVYRKATRMILGVEPTGPVGSSSDIATLDAAEASNLDRFDPAYLSSDGLHIQGTPPT